MAGLRDEVVQTDQDPECLIDQQPNILLFLIFNYLSAGDLVNAMRVCGKWKDVARDISLWRRMELRYHHGVDVDSFRHVLRLAPALGRLDCAGLLATRPVSRALLRAQCKVKSLVISPSRNQSLVVKLLEKHKDTLEELEVYGLDMSMKDVLEVINAMQLKKLTLAVPRSTSDTTPYRFKDRPVGRRSLQRLRLIGTGFPVETVATLIYANRHSLLYLGHEYEDEQIMKTMAECHNLSEVRLRSNRYLQPLERIVGLTALTLRCHGERGTDGHEPPCAKFLKKSSVSANLQDLTIWCHNFMCCNMLTVLAKKCPNLQMLSLVRCNVSSDQILTGMRHLRKLETLALTCNDYTSPRFLSRWKSSTAPGLKILDLRGTYLCQRERQCWAPQIRALRIAIPNLVIYCNECEHLRSSTK